MSSGCTGVHGKASTYIIDCCPPVSDVVRRSAARRTTTSTVGPSLWWVHSHGLQLAARRPPGSAEQWLFLPVLKDFTFLSVLAYTRRIRDVSENAFIGVYIILHSGCHRPSGSTKRTEGFLLELRKLILLKRTQLKRGPWSLVDRWLGDVDAVYNINRLRISISVLNAHQRLPSRSTLPNDKTLSSAIYPNGQTVYTSTLGDFNQSIKQSNIFDNTKKQNKQTDENEKITTKCIQKNSKTTCWSGHQGRDLL